ncbi:hypothetical protein L5M11_13125 [Shewanella sp. SM87]|uniref:hypothetical protein n=1 Tax=Shewanella sp. SM87 TaxID=2912808 RepID=UPI0021DB376F|nr:hypothetical protein [Shewanella sp. SM87]MCU8008457.1 hypothetical protein [Shewanella sp. SM87]
MKQRPIIFNTEMVQAILDGRKTQTRRMFKAQPHYDWAPFSKNAEWYTPTIVDKRGFYQPANYELFGVSDEDCAFVSPFGTIGDQFWVRETWRLFNSSDECGCSESPCSCQANGTVLFKAMGDSGESKWKPSIHMPRSCARILLEVTAVRVERLNDISEQDAKAEGINCVTFREEDLGLCEGFTHEKDDGNCQLARSAKRAFHKLWQSIYHNVEDNPWVWVIEFKVISTTGGAAC